MSGTDPESSQERETRLNALKTAVTEWADLEVKQLNDDAAFLESVVKGRTPPGELSDNVTEFVSTLVGDEINEFLAE